MGSITRGVASVALVGLGSSLAHAGITATAQQVGNNVVFTAGGTLDVSGLSPFIMNSVTANPSLSPSPIVRFSAGAPAAPGAVQVFATRAPDVVITGPASFGSGTAANATSGTGANTGFELLANFGPTSGLGAIVVPTGYVNGAALSGTATYNNHTLATLGITPGVYTWTWPTATGGTDFYTIVAPEPARLSLIVLAAAMLGRRRSL